MSETHQSVLILGANGRFGSHVAQAFANTGWTVLAQTRPSSKLHASLCHHAGITHCPIDISSQNDLLKAAKSCKLVINALNPAYHRWEAEVPKQSRAVLAIAKSLNATLLMPGNVYNFGATMPAVLEASTPHAATTQLGRIRTTMEAQYRAASEAGTQIIILRPGTFLQNEDGGGWFETHLSAKLPKGKFTYPGNTEIDHAWAYLPDVARAVVALSEIRTTLPNFNDIPFEGNTLKGSQFAAYLGNALNRKIKITKLPWGAVRLMALFNPDMKGVLEMRYLWDTPHRLDGSIMASLLPDFKATPLPDIIRNITARYA